MDGYLADDDAAAGALNLGSRRPMGNRGYAQSASGSPVRPQRLNFDPWLKQHTDASQPSHRGSPSQHSNHRQLRRLQKLNIFHSDPIQPSSPPIQHSQLFSPRWDSLSAGASPISSNSLPATPTPQRTRAESTPTPRPPPRSAFPGLCSNPFIPEAFESPTRTTVRQFPLLHAHDEVQHSPVTSPTTAAHAERLVKMRQPTPTEGNPPVVENFSRPRKPSVRSQNSEPPPSRHYHSSRLQPESALDQQSSTHVYPNYSRAPSPWSRSRGLSTSSSQSTSTFSSLPHQPSNDHLNTSSRASSVRRRDRTPTGTSSGTTRPPLTHANHNLTPNRERQPWLVADDELRSSFRSQLTVSTGQGTLFTPSGTERSSVLTKTSSVTEQSIINGYAHTSWRQSSYQDDGLSLEDVMGMYERGFNDSDIESIRKSMRFADDEDETQDTSNASGAMPFELSRPPSSRSDASAMRAKMLEAMNDQLPIPGALAVPEPSPASRMESRNSIRKSLLPSSLPKDMGLGFGEYMKRNRGVVQDQAKHDSAKLVDADDDLQRPVMADSPSPPTTLAKPSPPVDGTSEPPVSRPVTPAPAGQIPTEPPEEPGCRDRYGFKKANNNVTRQEYDAWDASYSEYLARRRKKWVAYLKDNSLMTDRPNRFPARNAKTKRFIRKGIPPDWRGAAWFYYAGGPAILSKHRGVYDDLVKRAALDPVGPGKVPNRATEVKSLVVEDIEKDLHRTFPDNVRFKPPRPATPPPQTPDNRRESDEPMDEAEAKRASEPAIITSLRRVLHAFALYNPRIGYCQSLNFLAGLLLLFVDTEEQAFWLLNVITRVYLPGTHEMSLEGSKVDLGVLMLALKDSLPNVWKQIGGDEHEGPTKRFRGRRGAKDNHAMGPGSNDPNRLPTITICMTAWFMSCFIGTLPIETVLRVWDVFFYEGSRTLFRIALTIFKLGESEIKAVADPMEMFGVVQSFPRKLIDCNVVMEACYRRRNGIGHLSQEVVEEKREERRAGIRKWRAEQEAAANAMAPVTAAAGLDLAADIDVHRKGPLFGKRKDKDREQVRADEVI
ncbi:hypothetical protein OQA88_2918 [Cercophora sp. LCS_1]